MIVPCATPSALLCEDEDVVPEPRLEVRLELREVEVPPVARVVPEEVEAEVEQRPGHRGAVDLEVALLEMPAARADEEHGDLVVQRVLLLARVERDRPLERIREVPLAGDAVLPGGGVRVLEVGHEDLRARVERVDHHLAVDRAGDLDATVGDLVRERRDPPVAGAHVGRLLEEVGQLACGQPAEPLRAAREELAAPVAELALEVGEEGDGVRREDVVDVHQRQSLSCGRRERSVVLVVALAVLGTRAWRELGAREDRRGKPCSCGGEADAFRGVPRRRRGSSGGIRSADSRFASEG